MGKGHFSLFSKHRAWISIGTLWGIAPNPSFQIFTKELHMDKDEKKTKENRQRNIPIFLRLNEKEKYVLDIKFKASGLRTESDFLRRLILYGDVLVPDFEEVRQMNHLLGKLGNNINQIAKKANTFDSLSQNDIAEVKEMMNRLWQSQKSILSKLRSAGQ